MFNIKRNFDVSYFYRNYGLSMEGRIGDIKAVYSNYSITFQNSIFNFKSLN